MSGSAFVYKNANRLMAVTGLVVFGCCIAYVLNTLFLNPGRHVDFGILYALSGYKLALLLSLVGLMGVANLYIETYKWWYMSARIEPVSQRRAVKSVLIGLAVGFITPNRLGDFPGRAIAFQKQHTAGIILMNMLAGYAQFIVICLLALFSLFFVPVQFNLFFNQGEAFRIGYAVLFAGLFVYHVWFLFKPLLFLNFFLRLKWLKRFREQFRYFTPLTAAENAQVLHFSVIRSLLYTLQLMYILYFFNPGIPLFGLFVTINLYFFALTVAPSFMLNKLGVRESLSVYMFSGLVDNPVVIVVSVMLLWVINQVIPACAGAWLMVKHNRA